MRKLRVGLVWLGIIFLRLNEGEAAIFKINLLSEDLKQEMKDKGTWTEECPVNLDRFRLIQFSYYDFNAQTHDDGEMVVLDAVAEAILGVFKELYKLRFPLAKAQRIEKYNGDDKASMADNNSLCFNCREIPGGGLPSLHSYGVAIDINPTQNPYIDLQESFLKGRNYFLTTA